MIAAYADKGQESDIEELRVFTAESMDALNDLETVVPDTARAALIEAAQVVNLIDTAAFRLCPSCGEGAAQVPEFDAAASVEGDAQQPWRCALGSADRSRAAEAAREGRRRERRPTRETRPARTAAARPTSRSTPPKAPTTSPPRAASTTVAAHGGGNGGGGNVIERLTDQLTGGGDGPENNSGGLGEVLDEALDNIVGGLLGGK